MKEMAVVARQDQERPESQGNKARLTQVRQKSRVAERGRQMPDWV